MTDRLLLDTAYIQALLNRNDQYHERAKQLFPIIQAADLVLITEAVLLEVGNALSAVAHRRKASQFINSCYNGVNGNLRVVPTDTELIRQSLNLFDNRPDKTWSLTDCVSFVVMDRNDIKDAATPDYNFVQANYRALMLEE